jgi:NAD(P)-dependent dehydrogenase (short-subunit alcohol dehydrogenase family)
VTAFELSGRHAFVVGGTGGIGAAIAGALAEAGASVVVGGRSARAERRIDITDPRSIAETVRWSAERTGPVDILVNAAGVSPIYKRAEAIADEEWDAIIATNLTGTFRACVAFGRAMLERRSGSIINVLSVAAVVGLPRLAAYCASKAGALGFTRSLAVEWADRGVRVNAIAPSFVRTELTKDLLDHERFGPELLASTPLGRFGEPADVAGAAVYLASDAARYVTGTALYVDGGWTAR